MKVWLEALQRSVTGKVLFIGTLVLVLLIPLGMIEGLVYERGDRYLTAQADIANAWGGHQTVGGPILVLPFRFTRLGAPEPPTLSDVLYVLPESLEIRGDVEVGERQRGIYSVPVFTGRLRVTGSFPVPNLQGDYAAVELLWSQAEIVVPLANPRALHEPLVLVSGETRVPFQAGSERVGGFGPQLVGRVPLGGDAPSAPIDFAFDLVTGFSETLRFLPLGDATHVSIASSWASPSFFGLLPSERTVEATGFTAEWRVLDLARGYPSSWRRSDGARWDVGASVFGATLLTPVGIHEATLRAAKYGVLVIGLTFAVYFLFEVFAALRLHTLQYLLIGLANCVFYLLLLALAEHVGFGTAYAVSAIASGGLVTSYSAAVLASVRRAAPVGALLGGLYAYLYTALRAEDLALLIGAIGSFAALAAVMYLTRRTDWFALTARGGDEPREEGLPLNA
jgi:inner membrane protein